MKILADIRDNRSVVAIADDNSIHKVFRFNDTDLDKILSGIIQKDSPSPEKVLVCRGRGRREELEKKAMADIFPGKDVAMLDLDELDDLNRSDIPDDNGIMFEIDRFVSSNSGKRLLLSGERAKYFAERMKSSIFATYNLVLLGLFQES